MKKYQMKSNLNLKNNLLPLILFSGLSLLSASGSAVVKLDSSVQTFDFHRSNRNDYRNSTVDVLVARQPHALHRALPIDYIPFLERASMYGFGDIYEDMINEANKNLPDGYKIKASDLKAPQISANEVTSLDLSRLHFARQLPVRFHYDGFNFLPKIGIFKGYAQASDYPVTQDTKALSKVSQSSLSPEILELISSELNPLRAPEYRKTKIIGDVWTRRVYAAEYRPGFFTKFGIKRKDIYRVTTETTHENGEKIFHIKEYTIDIPKIPFRESYKIYQNASMMVMKIETGITQSHKPSLTSQAPKEKLGAHLVLFGKSPVLSSELSSEAPFNTLVVARTPEAVQDLSDTKLVAKILSDRSSARMAACINLF